MSKKTTLGWHFTDGDKLRDGRPVPPVGEWLVHDGAVVMCESGLHFSERLIDALSYAPGARLHRVEAREVVKAQRDRGVARERRVLWTVPEDVMVPLLARFAWACAWRAQEHAASDAAWAALAANRAAWAAASDAAWAAASDAAWAAASDAASDAAWAAARAAAWAAARAEQATWLLAGLKAAGYDVEGGQL